MVKYNLLSVGESLNAIQAILRDEDNNFYHRVVERKEKYWFTNVYVHRYKPVVILYNNQTYVHVMVEYDIKEILEVYNSSSIEERKRILVAATYSPLNKERLKNVLKFTFSYENKTLPIQSGEFEEYLEGLRFYLIYKTKNEFFFYKCLLPGDITIRNTPVLDLEFYQIPEYPKSFPEESPTLDVDEIIISLIKQQLPLSREIVAKYNKNLKR